MAFRTLVTVRFDGSFFIIIVPVPPLVVEAVIIDPAAAVLTDAGKLDTPADLDIIDVKTVMSAPGGLVWGRPVTDTFVPVAGAGPPAVFFDGN